MAIDAQELKNLLEEYFSDADITLTDLRGDQDHYLLSIKSASFQGKNRVQQHQLVYEALKGKVGTQLHALALQTEPK